MLRMLTTHVLLCDGDDCAASLVPSGHYDPSKQIDAHILSDAVHAKREAAAAGWATGIKVAADTWHDLCPPHAAERQTPQRPATTAGAARPSQTTIDLPEMPS